MNSAVIEVHDDQIEQYLDTIQWNVFRPTAVPLIPSTCRISDSISISICYPSLFGDIQCEVLVQLESESLSAESVLSRYVRLLVHQQYLFGLQQLVEHRMLCLKPFHLKLTLFERRTRILMDVQKVGATDKV